MNNNICLFFSLILLTLSACKGESQADKNSAATNGAVISGSTVQQIEALGFQDPFLKRYEGIIDGEIEFEMILCNEGNGSIYGWYQYAKIGKKISLSGEVGLDESITLEEYTDAELTGKFIGDGSNLSQIKGQWSAAIGERELDFEMSEVKSSDDKTGWRGSWHLNDAWDGGLLTIGNVTKDSMDFSLNFTRNGHAGNILARAVINNNKARYKMPLSKGEEPCELVLIYRNEYIQIEQKSSPWDCGFGARAYAGGRYEAQAKKLKAMIPFGEEEFFKTEAEHNAFKEWIGTENYDLFAYNMQHSEVEEAEDGSQRILNGWVYGLAHSNKSILVQQKDNALYAATPEYRDGEESLIHYYSSTVQTIDTMIAPIKAWSESFDRYKVVYHYPN